VIVAAGEALVDCFPRRRGFVARSGGAPYNWARGLARAGAGAGFSGVLGRDAFGRRLRRGLAADGVAFLGRFSDAPTPIALVAGGSFRFYHRGTALEEPVDLPPARAYLLGSLALQLGRVVPPESGFLALDPNVRPGLTPPAFREAFARWAERAHLVKLSREDARWLGGDPYAYARALARRGPAVVLTLGREGAVGFVAGRRLAVPAVPARERDPTGAGDAFFAALVARLDALAGLGEAAPEPDPLLEAMRFAARVAAATVARLGALPPVSRRLPRA